MLQYVSMLKANQVSLRTGSLAVAVGLIKSIDARLLVSVFLSDSESASLTLSSLFYVWNAAERLTFSRIHSCTKAAPNWTCSHSNNVQTGRIRLLLSSQYKHQLHHEFSLSEHLRSSFVSWCRITLLGFYTEQLDCLLFSNLLPFSAHCRSRWSCTRNSSPIS